MSQRPPAQPPSSKRSKTSHSPGSNSNPKPTAQGMAGPPPAAAAAAGCHLLEYRYSASNVFARIQSGLQDSEGLLFNQAHTFALLDQRPVSRGHALLVVKQAAATLLDLDVSGEAGAQVLRDLQVLARVLQAATGCTGLKVLQNNGPQAGQTVPQLHFHLIPCYPTPSTTTATTATAAAAAAAGVQEQQQAPEPQAAADDAGRQAQEEEAGPQADAQAQAQVQAEGEAGLLVARIRNLLPEPYAAAGGGFHVWAGSCEEMEALGAVLQQHLGAPGTVLLLSGHLGAGKSTISRGFVRSALGDPHLDVPSPTFLLCLSYKDDLAHDPAARQAQAQQQQQRQQQQEQLEQEAAGSGAGGGGCAAAAAAVAGPPTVHHMDPYRLGGKADKMAGLIDFEAAFRDDVCLIEWPDRMPAEVMKLPMRGVSVQVSGTGAQAAGRLVCIQALSPEDPAAQVLAAWKLSGSCPAPATRQAPRAPGPSGRPLNAPFPEGLSGAGGPDPSPGFKALPADPAQWLVLGIESSCDDTAAAVIAGDGTVRGHRIASQAGLHEQYGGVKPDVARDAHARSIEETVSGCLADAGVTEEELSAVAVTVGPGLSLCLQVGVGHALTIAARQRLPVVPVHHMEAHALITRLPSLSPGQLPPSFPALLLLVSGGHNMLVLSEGVGRHRIMGTTLDDSIGECFDKVARLLGITAIPGGPHLEVLANKGEALLAELAAAAAGARAAARALSPYELTMPMQTGQHRGSCNFSFSGLKTGASKLVEAARTRLGLAPTLYQGPGARAPAAAAAAAAEAAAGPDVEEELQKAAALIAASLQRVSVRFLQQRTRRALSWLAEDAAQHGGPPVSCLIIAGGVAANAAVRKGLEDAAAAFNIPCMCPPIRYCMDNGLMVAWTGIERLRLGLFRPPPPSVEAVAANVDVLPRWPIGPVDPRSAAGMQHIKAFH